MVVNSQLIRCGLADAGDGAGVTSAKLSEVLSRATEAQVRVRSTPNVVCVVVVLPVIFPETDGTNLVTRSLEKRSATAARAAIQVPVSCWWLTDVREGHGELSGLTLSVQLRGPLTAASGFPFGPAARVSCNAELGGCRRVEAPHRERPPSLSAERARSAMAAPPRAAPWLRSSEPPLIRFA